MLYSFVKILMKAGLRFFYRHVHVTGFENIPAKGPAILIANHNSSLMDAALLGILLKRKAYFFARGDVFVNRPVKKILWWLHMLPVHSNQGGKKTVAVNQNSFAGGRQILSAGGIIVFFPESTSHVEHQLLPFRKGVFRLAFDTAAANRFSFNIPIVPVGITYDDPVACRQEAQAHAGIPIFLSQYYEQYRKNPAAALLQVCKDAQSAMHKLVLHVSEDHRLPLAGHCMTISRNNQPEATIRWAIASARKLSGEQQICAAVNNGQGHAEREQAVLAYFNSLSTAGTDDALVAGRPYPAWKKIMLWLGFPIYAAGLLLNGLPILLARRAADKKVYRKDFYSWIFVACCSVGYFLWLLIILCIAAFWGWPITLGILGSMVLTGVFAYLYKGWLQDWRRYRHWTKLPALIKTGLQTQRAGCNCLWANVFNPVPAASMQYP